MGKEQIRKKKELHKKQKNKKIHDKKKKIKKKKRERKKKRKIKKKKMKEKNKKKKKKGKKKGKSRDGAVWSASLLVGGVGTRPHASDKPIRGTAPSRRTESSVSFFQMAFFIYVRPYYFKRKPVGKEQTDLPPQPDPARMSVIFWPFISVAPCPHDSPLCRRLAGQSRTLAEEERTKRASTIHPINEAKGKIPHRPPPLPPFPSCPGPRVLQPGEG
jgi:hypothetical protein